MIRFGSEFCKRGKVASSCAAGRQIFRYFAMRGMFQDFNEHQMNLN